MCSVYRAYRGLHLCPSLHAGFHIENARNEAVALAIVKDNLGLRAEQPLLHTTLLPAPEAALVEFDPAITVIKVDLLRRVAARAFLTQGEPARAMAAGRAAMRSSQRRVTVHQDAFPLRGVTVQRCLALYTIGRAIRSARGRRICQDPMACLIHGRVGS